MKKLVVIVGAGASCELGLPAGFDLRNKISELLRLKFDDWGSKLQYGDRHVYDALKLVSKKNFNQDTINPYFADLHHIAYAMPQAYSIDHFINDQRGNERIELCGKLGITRAILKAENESSIHLRNERNSEHIDFSQTEDTWLNHFARLITRGCTKGDLAKRFSTVSLISFNYDRCIEHFLHHWLQVYYRLDQSESALILRDLKVFHPYGTIGRLPWQQGAETAVPFGGSISPGDLLEVSRLIKTFTEGTDPNSSEILAIRDCIGSAERILFLGFAYYDLNLDLLEGGRLAQLSRRNIYGTSLGISEFDRKAISLELANRFKVSSDFVQLGNLKCAKIFSEFSKGLSF